MKRYKYAAVLALAVFVAGCSSSSSKTELPPQALEKFTAEIELKKEWSTSIGDGQGKLWNTLTPAADDSRLFVTDVNGRVSALDRFSGKAIWTRKLKLNVSGGVGTGSGLVLLGTLNGDVIALDADSGERFLKLSPVLLEVMELRSTPNRKSVRYWWKGERRGESVSRMGPRYMPILFSPMPPLMSHSINS